MSFLHRFFHICSGLIIVPKFSITIIHLDTKYEVIIKLNKENIKMPVFNKLICIKQYFLYLSINNSIFSKIICKKIENVIFKKLELFVQILSLRRGIPLYYKKYMYQSSKILHKLHFLIFQKADLKRRRFVSFEIQIYDPNHSK